VRSSFRLDGITYHLDVMKESGSVLVTLDGASLSVDARWLSETELSLIIDGRSFVAIIVKAGKKRSVSIGGEQYTIEEVGEDDAEVKPAGGSAHEALASPMPGKVIKVRVRDGESVKKGMSLVIVEAMKMENEIRASRDSLVKKVLVKEGDVVEAGAALVDLEPAAEGNSG
jgi:biotin carboxyl carrier protein